jgi:hypothetical protein
MPININTYCRVNRNGSININTDPTFPEPPPPPDPNFLCVNGAGSALNGTYKFYDFYTSGNNGTRPRYIPINNVDDSGIQILAGIPFGGSPYRWAVYSFDGETSTTYYAGNTTPVPEYPWLETSWTAYDGAAPVPTLTIGLCSP